MVFRDRQTEKLSDKLGSEDSQKVTRHWIMNLQVLHRPNCLCSLLYTCSMTKHWCHVFQKHQGTTAAFSTSHRIIHGWKAHEAPSKSIVSDWCKSWNNHSFFGGPGPYCFTWICVVNQNDLDSTWLWNPFLTRSNIDDGLLCSGAVYICLGSWVYPLAWCVRVTSAYVSRSYR